MPEPVLALEAIGHHYPLPRRRLFERAPTRPVLERVSLRIERAETVALVGESGSGKSTLARIAAGLERARSGHVRVMGRSLDGSPEEQRRARRQIAMVFQDPQGSLDPRMRITHSIEEPLRNRGIAAAERRRRVADSLAEVGLDPALATAYPHRLSGGQRQRVAIARAIIGEPALLIADEPTSALDVSTQAQILALLGTLKRRHGMAMLFISHDLAVVAHIADRIAVLDGGRIVEEAATPQLIAEPAEATTRALLAAVLPPDPKAARRILFGDDGTAGLA